MKRTVRSVKSVAIVRTMKSEAIEQTTKCLSTVRTTKSEAIERTTKCLSTVRTTKSEVIERTTKCLSTVRTTKSEATKGQYSKVGSNRRSMVFIVGEPIAKKRYDRESE